MGTDLLYHQDDYRASFEAKVLEVDREARSLVLDRTLFFPSGGHQHCDQGRIEKGRSSFAVVTDVTRDDSGAVHHVYEILQGAIEPGDRVKGSIEWPRRYHHMRLHTAQHLFSRFASERFTEATGRASFSPNGGKVVMQSELSWEQIFVLEDDVNRTIAADLDVRRVIDERGRITIEIEALHHDLCGGTHVRSTAEIELFKVIAVDRKNIFYEVGRRAIRASARLANEALRSAAILGCSDPIDLGHVIQKEMQSTQRASRRAFEWEERVTEMQIAAARRRAVRITEGTVLLQLDASHLSAKTVRNMLKKDLLEDNQIWVCLADRRNLLVATSSPAHDAERLLAPFRKRWHMMGAGAAGLAQAGPIPKDIEDPLGWIVNSLLEYDREAAEFAPPTLS